MVMRLQLIHYFTCNKRIAELMLFHRNKRRV